MVCDLQMLKTNNKYMLSYRKSDMEPIMGERIAIANVKNFSISEEQIGYGHEEADHGKFHGESDTHFYIYVSIFL